MNINLKVRLKNPGFWVTIVPAVVTFTYCMLGAFDVVPALSENAAVNIAIAIINALTTLGVLVDPTTKGVGDSERAMEYTEPWDGDGK